MTYLNIYSRLALLFMLAVSGSGCHAEEDTIYLDKTFISGNQELPKVLYILPWKDRSGEVIPAINPVLKMPDILSPIYPHEYRLEMSYRLLVRRNNQLLQSIEASSTHD